MLQSTTNTAAITCEIRRYTEWQVVVEKTHKKRKMANEAVTQN